MSACDQVFLGRVLLACAIVSPPAALQAGPPLRNEVSITTNYYTVTGATLAEISASKVQARPWKTDMDCDGYTTWDISWHFQTSFNGEKAHLDTFHTRTKILVTLPRWTPPANTDRDLVWRWNHFVKAIETHEQGHIDLARQGVGELRRRVAALRTAPSEDELKAQVDGAARQALKDLQKQQDEYDQRTGHGVTQGASLGW